jgi:hypothetical protein
MMRTALLSLALTAAAALPAVRAQAPTTAPVPGAMPSPRPGDDPLARLFFPPELVIDHAQDIGLEPGQRASIVAAIKAAQSDMIDFKMAMAERAQELARLAGEVRVNEPAALAQVDRVLEIERGIKRRQMQLLIHIKNTLPPEQQQRLAAIRDRGSPGE